MTAGNPGIQCVTCGFPRQRDALGRHQEKRARNGIAVPGQVLQVFVQQGGRESTNTRGHRRSPLEFSLYGYVHKPQHLPALAGSGCPHPAGAGRRAGRAGSLLQLLPVRQRTEPVRHLAV